MLEKCLLSITSYPLDLFIIKSEELHLLLLPHSCQQHVLKQIELVSQQMVEFLLQTLSVHVISSVFDLVLIILLRTLVHNVVVLGCTSFGSTRSFVVSIWTFELTLLSFLLNLGFSCVVFVVFAVS